MPLRYLLSVLTLLPVDTVNCVQTLKELANYKGADDGSIYIAIQRRVFDVSTGRDFYGPGSGHGAWVSTETCTPGCDCFPTPAPLDVSRRVTNAIPLGDHVRIGSHCKLRPNTEGTPCFLG
jgi:predicted heme/steroid binding protein